MSINPQAITEGEYLVDGQAVVVTRSPKGAVTGHTPAGKWLAVLASNGRTEGRSRLLKVLAGTVEGEVKPVVRCPDCGTVVTDEDSIAQVLAGTFQCRGGAA